MTRRRPMHVNLKQQYEPNTNAMRTYFVPVNPHTLVPHTIVHSSFCHLPGRPPTVSGRLPLFEHLPHSLVLQSSPHGEVLWQHNQKFHAIQQFKITRVEAKMQRDNLAINKPQNICASGNCMSLMNAWAISCMKRQIHCRTYSVHGADIVKIFVDCLVTREVKCFLQYITAL